METYFNIRYEFDREEVHNAIERRLQLPGSDYICVASGTIITQVHRNLDYRKVVNGGLFTICDSSYVPIYLKRIYGINRVQYCGSQIFERIVKEGKYRMIFLGTDNATLAGLKKELTKLNPAVESMQFIELPFKKAEDFDYKGIAKIVESDKADIVWVALGAPKQEIFMSKLKPFLSHGVMLGVGAAFKFYSGTGVKRAPEWMVNNHLEFLYRIFQEPKKQLKRCWDDIVTLPNILREEIKNKRTKRSNILLFGDGLQILSLAKGLSKDNYNIVAYGSSNSISKASKFVSQVKCINLEELDELSFISEIREKKIRAIIPTQDEYTLWLSKHKSQIEASTEAKCAVMDEDVLKKVIDKTSLMELCKGYSVPHPKTIEIDAINPSKGVKDFNFPAIIKPSIANGSRGIKLVNDYSEFSDSITSIINNYGNCALQEYIPNKHYYNVMIYRYKDGSWGNYTIIKILRYYPIRGGSSCFCTSVENNRVLEISKQLLECLNWVGFADIDILEKEIGEYRVIEINPRVPASLNASMISGVNFGKIIVSDLLDGKKESYVYSPGKNLRYLGLDIAWFLSSSDRFKCSPTWFNFFDKNTFYQEGSKEDWKPMVHAMFSGAIKQLNPSFRKEKSGMN